MKTVKKKNGKFGNKFNCKASDRVANDIVDRFVNKAVDQLAGVNISFYSQVFHLGKVSHF